MAGGPSSFRVRMEAIVAEYLGARTAGSAIRLAATSSVHRDADALRAEDLPALRRGLEPMLRTFLGAEITGVVLRRLDEEARA